MAEEDRFDYAFRFLMDLEGWGEDHHVQGDPGGRTRYGISRNNHPQVWADGPPDEARARCFYREAYWDVLRLGEVRSRVVAAEILEFAVHSSTPRKGQSNVAVLTAQEAVNDVRAKWRGDLEDIWEDGVIGPQTLAALNTLEPGSVAELAWDGRFNLRQLRWLRTRRRDLVEKFFVGWTRRVVL